ncbi:MAG: type II secretion system major pseudopilin GspG [Pirellulaceae bacterium]
MNRRFVTRCNRSRGFTLVEMLVVLAILVLLVSMVAPRVLKSQKKADVQTAKTQIGTLTKCLKFYALDMKNYPTTEDGLAALMSAPEEDETSSSKWDGPYVDRDKIPEDPWGNEYQYEFPATRGSGPDPDIWSYGPDGEDDTDDDVHSWSGSGEGGEDGEFNESEPELDLEE